MLSWYLGGFPAFAAYFGVALLMLGAFGAVYSQLTPHHELRLIRRGCTAAIPAFLGALIGYVLPLTAAMRASVNLTDFLIWSAIAAVVQMLAYLVARLVMPDVSKRITENDVSAGSLLGGIALAFGLINAAAMTP
jgi:putative membrane protein